MARPSELAVEGKISARRPLFVLYASIALGLIAAAYRYRSELLAGLYQLESVVAVLGPLAPVAITVVCGMWGALCLPGPLMQGLVASIFAKEPLLAVLVVTMGEGLAQATAFAIARHLGRERIRQKLQHKPWFAWLETETLERGVYGVFLVRLMPFFPNALGSYAFGLTSLRFWPYLAASVLGSIPKMFLYIFGATSVIRLVSAGGFTPGKFALLALTVVALATILRRFQVWLRRRGHLSED